MTIADVALESRTSGKTPSLLGSQNALLVKNRFVNVSVRNMAMNLAFDLYAVNWFSFSFQLTSIGQPQGTARPNFTQARALNLTRFRKTFPISLLSVERDFP